MELKTDKKYNIILADPPWEYQQFSDSKQGAVKAQYQTMNMEELYKMEVSKIADDNCILFMWATFPKLKEALSLIEKWGFEYKTVAFVWVKKNKSGIGYFHGIGFHTASNAEIVLLSKKGDLKRRDKGIKQLVFASLTNHSAKPHEVYSRIERLYGNLPRIELFSRHKREGWDVWGLEAPDDTQKLLSPVITDESPV